MEKFIEEIELKFSTDVETLIKNVLAARYSWDDIVEIVYLYLKYTENAFIDKEKFAQDASFIGIKELLTKIHEIGFNYERYKRELVADDK